MNEKDYHEEIVKHLEFLGYELSDLKPEDGYTYVAQKQNKSTLVVRIFQNVTILTTRWNGFLPSALKSREFFITMNDINQSVMGKWYYQLNENEDDVIILTEMDYYDYNKTTFATLVERLEDEVQANLALFAKFVKSE